MNFDSFKKYALLLLLIELLVGCSKSEWKKGTTTFLQDVAYNTAQSDCDIYNRGTSQYNECADQVDTFYNEHYPNNNIIDK